MTTMPFVERIYEARRFVPGGLDQTRLSRRCGFGSTQEGNELTEEDRWRKMSLMVIIAMGVWGKHISR
jgi:5-methyltetrahydropteroyltriglutamate--homocysteine methyltransferase